MPLGKGESSLIRRDTYIYIYVLRERDNLVMTENLHDLCKTWKSIVYRDARTLHHVKTSTDLIRYRVQALEHRKIHVVLKMYTPLWNYLGSAI